MKLINKLLTGAFAVVAFIAWIVSFGVIKKKEGKAEAQAEHTASELEAMRDRDDYIDEIESHNRTITTDELYDGLRKQASERGD